MEAREIHEILNRRVFQHEKSYLIESLTKNYPRFVGIFRSTDPCLKLKQNLLQSREIRFGDALEEIIGRLIESMGYIPCDKILRLPDGKTLNCDQYFFDPKSSHYYLVEQKVRDDHDSSKKSGQVTNFQRKLEILRREHGDNLTGVMYFIDPTLKKNKRYYQTELKNLADKYGDELLLCYNGEFFECLGDGKVWEILENALIEWRETVPRDIALNFDVEPKVAVYETQSIEPAIWLKFAWIDELWNTGVIRCIFPNGEALKAITLEMQDRIALETNKRNCAILQKTVAKLKERLRNDYKIEI